MDKGIEEASEPEPEPEPEPTTEANAEDEPAPGGEPEPAKADGETDVEAEMASLGIKSERSKERFRELSTKVETLSKALAEAGVKDVAELPHLAKRAKDGEDMVAMVMDTGADSAQFSQALGYLTLVNAAGKGDREAAEKAFDMMQTELVALGQFLGKDVPGIVDPLAEYPDLAEEVENGDLTRKRAVEIAATRNQGKVAKAHGDRVQAAETQTRQQQEAVEAGRADIVAWDAQMQANDPAYLSKRDTLNDIVAQIRATKPPSEWLRETALAYAKIPTPAAATVAKPAPGPVRGNRGTQGMVPDLSKMSMADALDAALG